MKEKESANGEKQLPTKKDRNVNIKNIYYNNVIFSLHYKL